MSSFNRRPQSIGFGLLGRNFNAELDGSVLCDPANESAENLAGWVEDSYRDLIDKTEFLDSSRVKRID